MNKAVKSLRSFFNTRSLRYGSNSIILVAVVVAIALVINVLVGMIPVRWDLTSNKLFTIGDTTKDILKNLKKDVTIYGLFDDGKISSGSDTKQIDELLKQYRKSPRIKLVYEDPDKNPGFIKKLDPDGLKDLQKDDFVVVCGSKMKKLSSYDLYETQMDQTSFQTYVTGSKAEQAFTGAIKYVTADKTPTFYFLEGHQEINIDSSDYSTLKDYLEKNNYAVKTINLMTQARIPDDAEILMVASPKKDLSRDERDKVEQFLKNGGNAVFLFDSLESDPDMKEFEDLLSSYNIGLNYDKVKENDSTKHVPDNQYDLLPEVQSNAINSFPDTFMMLMPKSRSLRILKNQKEYITVTSLMKTSSSAVGEQIDKSRGADLVGPLDLAVVSENTGGSKPTKVLVIGNGYFMSDTAIQQYQNYSINGMYFFLNSLSWLQSKKDDALIAPKMYTSETMNINAQQSLICTILIMVVLPLLILGSGMFVWLRRRHL